MNKQNIIDISVPLSAKLPVWPGGHGVNIISLHNIGTQSDANVSRLDIDVHSGTHIDAPLHFVRNGKTTNDLALDRLIGNCFILEISDKITTITASVLENSLIPQGTKRLLLKTRNSYNNLWDKSVFDKNFTALSSDASQWIVDHEIDLIGIDYCSIQKFDDPPTTHQILLKNNVIILEGIDLRKVNQGNYQLTCLPISVEGVEGVPVRAILTENNI